MSIRIGLRQLIESIILEEGFKDDLRYLVEKFPSQAADLESLGEAESDSLCVHLMPFFPQLFNQ
jgi:hypothetical protein